MLIERNGRVLRLKISLMDGGNPPANVVTVDGVPVTVDGQYVVATP